MLFSVVACLSYLIIHYLQLGQIQQTNPDQKLGCPAAGQPKWQTKSDQEIESTTHTHTHTHTDTLTGHIHCVSFEPHIECKWRKFKLQTNNFRKMCDVNFVSHFLPLFSLLSFPSTHISLLFPCTVNCVFYACVSDVVDDNKEVVKK